MNALHIFYLAMVSICRAEAGGKSQVTETVEKFKHLKSKGLCFGIELLGQVEPEGKSPAGSGIGQLRRDVRCIFVHIEIGSELQTLA
jgi:hypothetical protein